MLCRFAIVCLLAAFAASPLFAQDGSGSGAGGPTPEQMKAMKEAWEKHAAVNEHHKRLADLVGKWTYGLKSWHQPGEPEQSTGTTHTKSWLAGRFVKGEHAGSVKMDGKDVDFHGISVIGYDNQKQKYTSLWFDNFSTMYIALEGSYDDATKTFSFSGQYTCCMTNEEVKVRETLVITDANNHVFTWYEVRGTAPEAKTMEISYTRKAEKDEPKKDAPSK